MTTKDWAQLVLVVLLVGGLALRARLWLTRYRRGGKGDRDLLKQAHATQESVVRLAAERHWEVRRGESAKEPFPAALAAQAITMGECDMVVTGEGFRALSYTAFTSRRASPLKYAIRVHLLHCDAPQVRADLVMRDLPVLWTPLLFPDRFHGRASQLAEGQLVAAGDYDAVRERLAPLEGRIIEAAVWVVASEGAVRLLAHWEPSAAELDTWLQLARDVAVALS